MKILLMEDDEILNEVVSDFLKSKGYDVYEAFDGDEAEEAIYENSFDLLLLDVNVPGINGFKLLKKLRDDNINIPAIFITSLDNPHDLKEGFYSGCDDYIRKPFQFEELELRINNVKRLYKLDQNILCDLAPNVTYNFNTSTITKEGKEHTLSRKELKVFEYLLKNKDRTISIDELGLNVWSYDDKPSGATIRTYIKNFRKILGEGFITNIKGVGYRFN